MKKTILISILAILLIAVFLVPINQEQMITKSQTIISTRIPYIGTPTAVPIRTEYIEFQRIWNEDATNKDIRTEALVEIYEDNNPENEIDPTPSGNEVCEAIGLHCIRVEQKDADNFPIGTWSTMISSNPVDSVTCETDEVEIYNFATYSQVYAPYGYWYIGQRILNKELYMESFRRGEYTYMPTNIGVDAMMFNIKSNSEREGETRIVNIGETVYFEDHDNTRVTLYSTTYYSQYPEYSSGKMDVVRTANTIYRAVCSELAPKPTTFTPTKILRK